MVVASTIDYGRGMEPRWLDEQQIAAWVRFIAVVERLPGALDGQLRRDSALTHFEYHVLAQLSESPGRALRMSALASRTNATLPRLSHVVSRMEARGLLERIPCAEDRRASDVRLSDDGVAVIVAAAPGHVATVRRYVIDALSPEQIAQLSEISTVILTRLHPQGTAMPVGAERPGRATPTVATGGQPG